MIQRMYCIHSYQFTKQKLLLHLTFKVLNMEHKINFFQKQIKNFENEIDELHSRLAKGKSRTFTLTNKANRPII